MNLYIHASTFSRHPHEQYIYRDWKLCYTFIPAEYIYIYIYITVLIKKIDVTVCSAHLMI